MPLLPLRRTASEALGEAEEEGVVVVVVASSSEQQRAAIISTDHNNNSDDEAAAVVVAAVEEEAKGHSSSSSSSSGSETDDAEEEAVTMMLRPCKRTRRMARDVAVQRFVIEVYAAAPEEEDDFQLHVPTLERLGIPVQVLLMVKDRHSLFTVALRTRDRLRVTELARRFSPASYNAIAPTHTRIAPGGFRVQGNLGARDMQKLAETHQGIQLSMRRMDDSSYCWDRVQAWPDTAAWGVSDNWALGETTMDLVRAQCVELARLRTTYDSYAELVDQFNATQEQYNKARLQVEQQMNIQERLMALVDELRAVQAQGMVEVVVKTADHEHDDQGSGGTTTTTTLHAHLREAMGAQADEITTLKAQLDARNAVYEAQTRELDALRARLQARDRECNKLQTLNSRVNVLRMQVREYRTAVCELETSNTAQARELEEALKKAQQHLAGDGGVATQTADALRDERPAVVGVE